MTRILSHQLAPAVTMCALAGWLTACGRPVEPANAPKALATEATARPDATPASPPMAAVIPANDPSAMLNALTQVVRRYSVEKRRVPASLEEVVSAGYLQTLPAPPAGKKFVIEPKRLTVELQ